MTDNMKLGCAFAIACLVAGAVPGATANDLCGMTIVADLELDHDLICSGDGLVIGADGIRIKLNEHSVAGSGSGAGFVVTGRTDVSISGGTIRAFAVGVRLNTSTDIVIKDIEFAANGEGIDMQSGSLGNTIKDNAFRDHPVRAIMLRGNVIDNDIKDNTFTGNRIGILVFAGVDNTLKGNVISGSSLAGIRINVFATGNILKDNRVMSNAAGIEFLITPTGSATGNELKGNQLTANGCALKGPTAGNKFKDNLFLENVANTCA